jgi:hypothetical protein
MCSDPAIIRP